MTSELKEKFIIDAKAYAKERYPDDEDENERKYVESLANSYYDGKVDENKLDEEFKLMVEEEENRAALIKTIQALKAKHMPKPVVEEKKPDQPKNEPEVERKKYSGDKKFEGKGKIFDRIEGGVDRPSKKVKKEEDGDEKVEQNEGGELGLRENLKKKLETEGKQKCKFFPYCKNEETCEYFHPTEKCTYFPRCRHGDNCLYTHEKCRFKEKCTKMDCPFEHPFKKNDNPLKKMMEVMFKQAHPLKNKKKHQGKQGNEGQSKNE